MNIQLRSNRYKRIFLVFAIFSMFYNYTLTQEVTDAKIKAALIYKFLKYISWEFPISQDTFKIGIYGNDPVMLESLKKLEGKKHHNKIISIEQFNKVDDIISTDILYINFTENLEVKKIYYKNKYKPTLLITDRYEERREVMINFVHTNDQVQFELNSKNLDESNISVSPKLLLLGGTELDVRELYKETEKSLISEKEKSEKISLELDLKKMEVDSLSYNIIELYGNISELNYIIDSQIIKIEDHKSSLAQLNNALDTLKLNTRIQQLALDSASLALNNKNISINILDSLLIKKQNEVEYSVDSLNELNISIAEKEKALSDKIEKIQSQRVIIFIVIAFSIVVFFLLLNIYRVYTIKRKKNIELEKRNQQISIQKTQIEKQANKLKATNLELEKLSIVAEKTDNAVVIMDEKGEIEWVNEGFIRMFGHTLDEFIQNKGNNFITASTSQNPEYIIHDCTINKRTVSYESFIESKAGKRKWLQSTITPIVDKNNNVYKLVAIDSDISIIKDAEEKIINKNIEIQEKAEELRIYADNLIATNVELENQKAKAEQALKQLKSAQSQLVSAEKMVSLGQLTSGIAHEINNPVNYISSSIEGLNIIIEDVKLILNEYEGITKTNVLKKLNKIDELKHDLDYNELISGFGELTSNIKMGIDRTKEIVNSLRTFSRIDEDEFSIVDINQSINSTIILLGKQYKDRIKIIKDYGQIPKVECIEGKMNQVYLNILVNAIQAIKNQGIIKIKTSLISIKNVNYVKIEFSDSGSGITDKIKDKVFEPFFTTKEIGKGTGLGLSITYSIIQKHNGMIQLESEEGKGTNFIIHLPVSH